MRYGLRGGNWGEALPVWAGADGLGQFTLLVMPFLVGALVDELGFSLADAGFVVTTELSTLALTAFLVSPFMGSLPRHRLAVAGALIAVVANLVSAYGATFSVVALARGFAGFGCGLALAAGNAAVSSSADPEGLYDRKMILFAVQGIVLMLCFPWVLLYFGIEGTFVAMAVTTALLSWPAARLPEPTRPPPAVVDTRRAADVDSKGPFRRLAALAIIGAIVFFSLRESLAWGFSERIGADIGLSAQAVGMLLAAGALLGLIGPFLANWARGRFGAFRSAVTVALLGGVITYHIVLAPSQAQFAAFVLVWQIAYFSAIPLIMGIAATMDDQGRVVAACSGAMLLAYAAGPALGGMLAELGDKPALGYFSVVAAALSVLLIAIAGVRRNSFPETRAKLREIA